jgi:hypothetical protein
MLLIQFTLPFLCEAVFGGRDGEEAPIQSCIPYGIRQDEQRIEDVEVELD